MNNEKLKEYDKEYYQANVEKLKEYHKTWRKANPEKIKARNKANRAKPKTKFSNQRKSANARGIEWLLTFEEWLSWWEATGYFYERGRKKGQYCMARFNDTGPYALDNIKCITQAENTIEANRLKRRKLK